MQSPQFDAAEIRLDVGYDILSPELDPTPRLIGGSNMIATNKGKLAKRPGVVPVSDTGGTGTSFGFRVDRMTVIETLDTPSIIYCVVSAYLGSNTWGAYYRRLDFAFGSWLSLGTLRFIHASTRPHEFVVSRGLLFIKGYPSVGSGEKLGTVLFNPNGGAPYTTFWGLLGPSAPAALSASAGWAASANPVVVNAGWAYTYAYKTRSGHVSNRAPLQTNPSLSPSITPAFTNKRPSMTLQGHSDTINVPTICVYRTTDGGGTFFKLKEITNTGGSITFEDNGLASGALSNVFQDPMPDAYLDTSAKAPSLTSNTPPITVLDPKVVGVDTPQASTPIESFAGRFWLGIGNVLFFSGLEEVPEGVPEEAWPSGAFGNFFRVQYPIVSLKATTEALYVFTTQATYWVRGTTRDSLQCVPLFTDLGAKKGHPRAVAAADKSVIWLTHDYRIAIARGGTRDFLSDALGQTIRASCLAGAELYLTRFADSEKDLLIVGATYTDILSSPRQWIFDFNQGQRGIWNVPWFLPATACMAAQIFETTNTRYELRFFTWDGTTGGMVTLDFVGWSKQDWDWTTSTYGNFSCSAMFSPRGNPTGNHLNALRQPAMASVVYGVKMERADAGSDPTLYYSLDSLTSAVDAGPAITPPRRKPSAGYTTSQWNINQACERVGVLLSKPALNEPFEIQTLAIIWAPDSGA